MTNPITFSDGPPEDITVQLLIEDDANGGEDDESISLSLELVSPMEFSHLITLDSPGAGATDQLNIIIKDDDRKSGTRQICAVPCVECSKLTK